MSNVNKKSKDKIRTVKKSKPENVDYRVSLVTDRDRAKCIAKIERKVRSSLEYKDYVKYLKDYTGLDKCIFFNKISSKNKRHVSIEMHHEPFTLYDIAEVVLTKFITTDEKINISLMASEVMKIHYSNMVGLVPLSKTAHQIVHNSPDKAFVPLSFVYGEYSKFLEEYDEYISKDEDLCNRLYDKLERAIERTENLTKDSFDALVKEFTYIDIEGVDNVSKVEDPNQQNVA